jgi:hypothetical protein
MDKELEDIKVNSTNDEWAYPGQVGIVTFEVHSESDLIGFLDKSNKEIEKLGEERNGDG